MEKWAETALATHLSQNAAKLTFFWQLTKLLFWLALGTLVDWSVILPHIVYKLIPWFCNTLFPALEHPEKYWKSEHGSIMRCWTVQEIILMGEIVYLWKSNLQITPLVVNTENMRFVSRNV